MFDSSTVAKFYVRRIIFCEIPSQLTLVVVIHHDSLNAVWMLPLLGEPNSPAESEESGSALYAGQPLAYRSLSNRVFVLIHKRFPVLSKKVWHKLNSRENEC